jgi:hypothetical protein
MYGVYNFEEYLYIFLQGSKSIYSLCCAHLFTEASILQLIAVTLSIM